MASKTVIRPVGGQNEQMFTEPSTIKLYLPKQHLSSMLPLINLLVINVTEL